VAVVHDRFHERLEVGGVLVHARLDERCRLEHPTSKGGHLKGNTTMWNHQELFE
jgi:hypothetical protein